MNNYIRKVLNKRYEADIEDAKYKIKCFSEHELVIPEHPDITLEVDKLLQKIAEAEDKLAVMELHYGKNEAEKTILEYSVTDLKKIFFFSEKKCTLCPLGCFSLVYKAKWWTGGGHF